MEFELQWKKVISEIGLLLVHNLLLQIQHVEVFIFSFSLSFHYCYYFCQTVQHLIKPPQDALQGIVLKVSLAE